MSRATWAICLVTLFAGLSSAVGCGTVPASSAESSVVSQDRKFTGKYPIKVVCTTGMVADLARNVGGEQVKVRALMGAGVDPHLYKASPGDVGLLNGADVIFYSGVHLEGRMTDLWEYLARAKPTVAVASAIPEERILQTEAGAHDPHLWFDVALWSHGIDAVRDTLVAFDPAHADEYRENARRYHERLAKLHVETDSLIHTVPKQQRVMVTAHDAFQYFGRAYEIDVRGIQGISTDSEAGVRQVNNLVNFLVERKIKAVFVETSVSDQNIRSLLEGCAARGHKVVIGGSLFSDAMGAEGTPEGTYEGMIRHNVETIVKALK